MAVYPLKCPSDASTPGDRAWFDPRAGARRRRPLTRLERASVETVLYADLFDYPLTPLEVHRYLVGVRATPGAVAAALEESGGAGRFLARAGGFITLRDRAALAEQRRVRAAIALDLWEPARRYGAIIARLPFVRLVAVSGALALDNVDRDADIDYFIVTEADRLWLCRAAVIALVRMAARRGVTICPNYFLSERALVLGDRNLFSAHELVQMVPIGGLRTYHRLRALNAWSDEFLPNARGAPRVMEPHADAPPWGTAAAEWAGRTAVGRWVEGWEMRRKVRRFRGRSNGSGEAAFDRDSCKGHFAGYGERVLETFAERLRALE